MRYPETKSGPVISLAVDRNQDLWIATATGGNYHFTHGAWSKQNDALGKKARHPRNDDWGRRGERLVWLLQQPG